MADFKTAKVWLSEGEKVRPKNWSSWHFIFWDANSLCCRDEDKDIIDISKFDDSDFEIYTEESKCEKMKDKITEAVEDWFNQYKPKESTEKIIGNQELQRMGVDTTCEVTHRVVPTFTDKKKEDLIIKLKKAISNEIQDVQTKLIDPSKTQQYIDGVNDFMIKLKHGLVGE